MPAIATVPTAHELQESNHHPFRRANVCIYIYKASKRSTWCAVAMVASAECIIWRGCMYYHVCVHADATVVSAEGKQAIHLVCSRHGCECGIIIWRWCMYYHCVYADATVASAEDNESIMNIANATVASAEVEYTYTHLCQRWHPSWSEVKSMLATLVCADDAKSRRYILRC
jgi:hypothetical protein